MSSHSSSSNSTIFALLKVSELKEELKSRGLPTNGLKAELLARLQQAHQSPSLVAETPIATSDERTEPAPKRSKTDDASDFDSVSDMGVRLELLIDRLNSPHHFSSALAYLHSSLLLFQQEYEEEFAHELALARLEFAFASQQKQQQLPSYYEKCARFQQACFEVLNMLPMDGRASEFVAKHLPEMEITNALYNAIVGPEAKTAVTDQATLKRSLQHYFFAENFHERISFHAKDGAERVRDFVFTSRRAHSFEHLRARLVFTSLLRLVVRPSTNRVRVFTTSKPSSALFLRREADGQVHLVEKGEAEDSKVGVQYCALTNQQDMALGKQILAIKTASAGAFYSVGEEAAVAADSALGGKLANTEEQVVDACMVAGVKPVYVAMESGEDTAPILASTIAALLKRFPQSRILLHSIKAERVAHLARKMADLSLLDVISVEEEEEGGGQFSSARCIARFNKQRAKTLEECIAAYQGPREVAQVLFPNCQTAIATAAAPSAKLQDLAKWELFQNNTPEQQVNYLARVRCRLVLTAHGNAQGVFDYIFLDGVSTQHALLAATSSSSSARATRALICVATGAKPDFPTSKYLKYAAGSQRRDSFCAGFESAVQMVHCTTAREEAEFAALTLKYASKLGYSNVRVCAWTEQQCDLVQDACRRERNDKSSVMIPGCVLLGEEIECEAYELTIACAGGVASPPPQLSKCAPNQAFIVFAGNADWKPRPGLRLVLGERVGEDFDEELRRESLFTANKPADLAAITTSL